MGKTVIMPVNPGTGWQPQPDWYDIKKIFESDTSPDKRFIVLLTDTNNTVTITRPEWGNAAAYFKTSDGQTYNADSNVHDWNNTADKPCSLGYRTRYVIVYSKNPTVYCVPGETSIKYIYFGNGSNTGIWQFGSTIIKTANVVLEAIECDGTVTGMSGDMILQTNTFFNCRSLQKIDIPQGITRFPQDCFEYCGSLSSLSIPDSIIGGMSFTGCHALLALYIKQGWKPESNIILSDSYNMSHSAIVDFFNKLGPVENTVIIYMGTQLEKLTVSEKDIATNKGYTLA